MAARLSQRGGELRPTIERVMPFAGFDLDELGMNATKLHRLREREDPVDPPRGKQAYLSAEGGAESAESEE